MNVVEVDWLPVAGRFGQTDISGYDGFKYLRSKKAAEVRCDLLRQGSPLIKHGKDDALDCETGIQCSSDSHERI